MLSPSTASARRMAESAPSRSAGWPTRPKMIIAGFSAYSRVIDWSRFAVIAKSVGAYFVVDMAHVAGLVARCGCIRTGGRTPTWSPPPRTRRCAARAAGWCSRAPTTRSPRSWTQVAGHAGRPADARDRRQGGAPRGAAAGVQGLPAPGAGECARHGGALHQARLPDRVRRHRQSPVPHEPRGPQYHRQGCGCGARCANITVNKNAVPNDRAAHGHRAGCASAVPPPPPVASAKPRSSRWSTSSRRSSMPRAPAAAVERVRPQVIEPLCRRFPVYQ